LYSGALAEGDFSINEQAALNVPRLYIKAGGNVGIGTESPSQKLNVVGDANITGNLYASSGVQGDSSSNDGVVGWTGNSGKSGVYGYSSAGTGVTGRSEAALGRGVFGRAIASDGIGVYGWGSGTAGTGVYGKANGTDGYAVYGEASSSSGMNFGGWFSSASTGGTGVWAEAPNTGVHGYSYSADGRGVYGEAHGSGGVGVYGKSSSGYAGLFDGDVNVVGEAHFADRVGIGTTSPEAGGLHVRKHASASPGIICEMFQQGFPTFSHVGIISKVSGVDVGAIAIMAEATGDYMGGTGTGVDANGTAYDFYASGPGTDYGSASSIRWKSDIRRIDDALGKVLRLRGVYFNWDSAHGGRHDVGMVAEEVGEVLPEIVSYEENGVDATGMDYSKLTPLLVEAVKALKAEVDNVRQHDAEKDAQIEALKQRSERLKGRLAAMEAAVGTLVEQQEGGRL
jgi:hypothetical protein